MMNKIQLHFEYLLFYDSSDAVQTCKIVLLHCCSIKIYATVHSWFKIKRCFNPDVTFWKINRLRYSATMWMSSSAGEAESIMDSERERLEMPHGMPTFDGVEKERRSRGSLGSLLERWRLHSHGQSDFFKPDGVGAKKERKKKFINFWISVLQKNWVSHTG